MIFSCCVSENSTRMLGWIRFELLHSCVLWASQLVFNDLLICVLFFTMLLVAQCVNSLFGLPCSHLADMVGSADDDPITMEQYRMIGSRTNSDNKLPALTRQSKSSTSLRAASSRNMITVNPSGDGGDVTYFEQRQGRGGVGNNRGGNALSSEEDGGAGGDKTPVLHPAVAARKFLGAVGQYWTG